MCYLCDFGSDFIYGFRKWVSWFMIPPYSICDGLTTIDVCVIVFSILCAKAEYC